MADDAEMADNRFNIEKDFLEKNGIKLNIPPFQKVEVRSLWRI